MKNAFLISCLVMFSITAFAQNIWLGGAPGHETDWMEARNWSKQRVPGWEDNVVIPHLWHDSYPEISTSVPAVAHLEVEGGARLNITGEGYLPIDGSSANDHGLLLAGKIIIEGALAITNTARESIGGNLNNLDIRESGRLTFDGQLMAYESRGTN